MADIDAALVKQILDIAQRQRKSDVQHHRQTDDLWIAVEVFERIAFRHPQRLRDHPARLNRIPSDTAPPKINLPGQAHSHSCRDPTVASATTA